MNFHKTHARVLRAVLALGIIVLSSTPALAQDLDPKSLSPTPVGLNVGLIGYSNSQGNVFFDKSLLIEGATGEVHSMSAAYVRTFGIGGMFSKFTAVLPYAWGDWEGLVDGVPASTSRAGFADPIFKIAFNVFGVRALNVKEYAAYREGTVVGGSFTVSAPLGQYNPEKLINLGTNRWAFRPRLGVSRKIGGWTLEALGDVWFYTENSEAYGNSVISQSPMGAVHGNVIYSFRGGYWVGFSGGVAGGGETTVNGVEKDNSQTNSRFGLTLSVPLNKRQALRISYLNSIKSLIGADFDLFAISYQYRWGGGL